jgi:hypothetical protein
MPALGVGAEAGQAEQGGFGEVGGDLLHQVDELALERLPHDHRLLGVIGLWCRWAKRWSSTHSTIGQAITGKPGTKKWLWIEKPGCG